MSNKRHRGSSEGVPPLPVQPVGGTEEHQRPDAELLKTGVHLENEREARANPKKFLRERVENAPLTDVVTLKLQSKYEREALHVAASPLGLRAHSVVAPLGADGTIPAVDTWFVVGRDKSAVGERAQEVSREATGVLQRLQEAWEETVASKLNASALHEVVWDVGGLWDIRFGLDDSKRVGWPNRIGHSLDIQFAQCSGDGVQMWATFSFLTRTGGLFGVFRFLAPNRDDEFSNDLSEDDFSFRVDDKPSPSFPKWNYCWRGDDKILYSGERLGSLTFGGVGGRVLTGVFDCDWLGKIEFTGLKTGPTPRSPSAEREVIGSG